MCRKGNKLGLDTLYSLVMQEATISFKEENRRGTFLLRGNNCACEEQIQEEGKGIKEAYCKSDGTLSDSMALGIIQ